MKLATKFKLINDDTMQAKDHLARFNGEPGISSSEIKLPIQIIRMKELTAMIGLSRSTIYNKINPRSRWHDKRFPIPISLGESAKGWLLEDIKKWLQSLS